MILKKTLLLVLIAISISLGMSKSGDLPADEFAKRRAIFLNELRDLNAIAILHSAPYAMRNGNVEYDYRQNSDFYYLTGWEHANAILVLTPQEKKAEHAEVTFYVTPRSSKMELWTGPKEGLDEALALPEVDQALAYDDFFTTLPKLLTGYDRLVVSYGNEKAFQAELGEALEASWGRPAIIQEASALTKAYRLIKSDAEIETLEKAIEITGESLKEAFAKIPSLQYEYEAQAEIEYGFFRRGVKRIGFPTIVGAGKNATYLHYEDNGGALVQGELLLLDVGAEWGYYTADISRTVPISGKFSPEQAKIYQLVLNAQLAAIESVKPGADRQAPHGRAIEVITEGLLELGLLEGELDTLIESRAYRKFFMHGTSHWLGLDVHDVGGYVDENKKPHTLKAGMVLTVEPGIYIAEPEDIDPKWWNIGVRIEDDVLVTSKGNRVLSADIPKTIKEIEAIMQAR